MDEISKYINYWKKISELVLSFLDNDDEKMSDSLKDQINFIKQNDDNKNLPTFLELLSNITLHHHRSKKFILKVEEILSLLIESIRQFSKNNYSVLKFFMNDKRILYYLSKQNFAIPQLLMMGELQIISYQEPRKKYGGSNKNVQNSEDFDKKCQIGENDSYICQLIRNDSIDEFINYVKKYNVSLTSRIKPSIFESHYALDCHKNQTLIEYACFFGSIKIFNYLRANGVILRPFLWIYAIRGRNIEIIHILEKNKIDVDDSDYENCIEESIKCFHNELANYFIKKYWNKSYFNSKFNEKIMDHHFYDRNIYYYAFKYHNYQFMPQKFNNKFYLFYLCQFNYIELVELLSKANMLDINIKIDILNENFNDISLCLLILLRKYFEGVLFLN